MAADDQPALTLDDLGRLSDLSLDAVNAWSKAADPALKTALLAVADQLHALKEGIAERAADEGFRGDVCDLWTAVGKRRRTE